MASGETSLFDNPNSKSGLSALQEAVSNLLDDVNQDIDLNGHQVINSGS